MANLSTQELNFKFAKHNFFWIEIQSGDIVRRYKHGASEWYKEYEYYPNSTILKKEISVSNGKFYGFIVEKQGIKMWKTKVIKQYYSNGKIKSVETVCGNSNDPDNDIFCGKQYYYQENGNRLKILNYYVKTECGENYYNNIISEGLHGIQYFYHQNNKIASEDVYFLGVKHGWCYLFDTKGKMIEKQIWHNGIMSNNFKQSTAPK